MKRVWLILMILVTPMTWAAAQIPADLGTWTGDIYWIDDYTRNHGYPGMHNLTMSLEKVSFDSLVFPSHHFLEPFPGTKTEDNYGMLLTNMMRVSKAGCYEFSVTSDDGSRLWLDDEELIDNDGAHKMKERRTRNHLEAGEHELRLWYYNGAPAQKGLIVRIVSVAPGEPCGERMVPLELSLGAQALFTSGEHRLLESSREMMDTLCAQLQGQPIRKLEVSGHTDDVGKPYDNFLLSQRRAGSVLQALRDCLGGLDGVEIVVKGYGASKAIAPNDSDSNRALNRRVEVKVE